MVSTAPPPPAIAIVSATKSVGVKDDFFTKSTLTVKKGTRVKWKWQGDSPHNVTVTSGPKKFRSSTKSSGSYKKKMRKKGTYSILCTVHAPDMKMTLKVK